MKLENILLLCLTQNLKVKKDAGLESHAQQTVKLIPGQTNA